MVNSNINNILIKMRADHIPPQEVGLWSITKILITDIENKFFKESNRALTPPGMYTILKRYTTPSLHLGGESVMNDFLPELKTHLNFVLKARGSVLITGLGLGCVVRGLLANNIVTQIDVIERDPKVIRMVWPYMPKDTRLNIIESDALDYCLQTEKEYDYAWHDVWNDPDKNEDPLYAIHGKLIKLMHGKAKHQSAWALPHKMKRMISRILLKERML